MVPVLPALVLQRHTAMQSEYLIFPRGFPVPNNKNMLPQWAPRAKQGLLQRELIVFDGWMAISYWTHFTCWVGRVQQQQEFGSWNVARKTRSRSLKLAVKKDQGDVACLGRTDPTLEPGCVVVPPFSTSAFVSKLTYKYNMYLQYSLFIGELPMKCTCT